MVNTTGIFTPGVPPRQAESADAHLYWHKAQNDQRRRRSNDNGYNDADETAQDQLEITLEALETFLMNYQMPPVPARSSAYSYNRILSGARLVYTSGTPSTASARVARAYGHAAEASQRNAGSSDHQMTPMPSVSAQNSSIEKLLSDLVLVKNRGIKTLTIGRAETFLKSLENAVSRALNA
jgi:hypothetical protein